MLVISLALPAVTEGGQGPVLQDAHGTGRRPQRIGRLLGAQPDGHPKDQHLLVLLRQARQHLEQGTFAPFAANIMQTYPEAKSK